MSPAGRIAWDPEVMERLAWLHLRARQAVAGFRSGPHASVRISPNVEFADYKEYTPGDPIRDVDWRVAARSDRIVVRRHRAEADLAGLVVLDCSGDIGTGTSGRAVRRGARTPLDGTKFGFAATLAATLCYWLHHQGDPVGLVLIGGTGAPWRTVPPRRGTGHLAQVMAVIASVEPSGRAGLDRAFVELSPRVQRRSLVVVVSDFMEEPAAWGPSLAAIARRKADVRAVQIHDRREWALDYGESARFVSPEDGRELPVDAPSARSSFQAVIDEYLAEVRSVLGSRRVHHVLVASDEPMDRALASVVRAA